MSPRRLPVLLLLAAALAAPACGFRLVGKSSTLPPHIQKIAVPVFRNETRREEVEQRITYAILGEIAKRGRVRTVPSEADADGVITGTVKRFETRPTQFDAEGRATVMQLQITAAVKFEDRRQGAVLWESPSFLFRQEYPITGLPATYYDLEAEALDEVARDFATSIVSTIFEGF